MTKKIFSTILMALTAVIILSACAADAATVTMLDGEPVVVGSKRHTNNIILGYIAYYALEAAGILVVDRMVTGSTADTRQALLNGEIDIYWAYTGNVTSELERARVANDTPQQQLEWLREMDAPNNIIWLDMAPSNNTTAIIMSGVRARELGIVNLSDMAEYMNNNAPLHFAGSVGFIDRVDGLRALADFYGTDFGDNITPMMTETVFSAVMSGQVDVGAVSGVDWRLEGDDFYVLVDDLGFFPFYHPTPTIRVEVLERFPQIPDILNPIAARLTNEAIRGLDYQIGSEGADPQIAARNWLRAEGFIN